MTEDPISERLNQWCRAHLGSPVAEVLFEVIRLSNVRGVVLADGRRIVVKAYPPGAHLDRLHAVFEVQTRLAEPTGHGELCSSIAMERDSSVKRYRTEWTLAELDWVGRHIGRSDARSIASADLIAKQVWARGVDTRVRRRIAPRPSEESDLKQASA